MTNVMSAKKMPAREPILEHDLGLESSCAMSIETLNSAARAAGFAMAMSDEPAEESKTEEKLESSGRRPGEAMLLEQTEATAKVGASFADRVKGVFGVLGRRAPA
jgi:hypothetical protein